MTDPESPRILTRGDIVRVATPGPYSGKPRPAVVLQSDLFNATHPSVTVGPLTSEVVDAPLFRLTVEPNEVNGLRTRSQVMIDKIFSAPRDHLDDRIGSLDPTSMQRVAEALRLWLEL